MENLVLTANTVLPIFLVMVIGFLFKQMRVVKPEHIQAMNKLVFQIFLPFSIAKSLMTAENKIGSKLLMMAFAICGIITVFLVYMFIVPKFVKENSRRGVLIHATFRSNTAILGIPLAEALFPEGDGGTMAMMIAATIPVFNILAVFTMEFFRGKKFNPKRTIIGIISNPLIWGCLIGLIFMFLPLELPTFLMSSVSKVAGIASPLALFALGATIDIRKIGKNAVPLIMGVGSRLILVPGVMLTIAYFLGFRGPEFAALMIAFGTPSAVSSYTMSAQMDGDPDLAAQLVMFSTIFCVVTIFGMVFLFKTLGIF